MTPTIYSIRVHGARGPGDVGYCVTITRTVDGKVIDGFAGFGPTLREQLCDARHNIRVALRGGK